MGVKKIIGCLGLGATLAAATSSASALTMQQAVKQTLMTNPNVLLEQNIRQASMAGVRVAEAGYLPSINANLGLGRERSLNVTTLFRPLNLTRREAGIVLDQMLFDGLFTPYNVARTKAQTNADAYNFWGTADNTALLAVEAYINVIRTRRIVGLARRNLSRHEKLYSLVVDRSTSGLGRRADIDQATSRLSLAKANLYAALNQYRDAVTTFKVVIGLSPKNLKAPHGPYRGAVPRSLNIALSRTINENPFIRSATADVAEAVNQMKTTRSPFLPRVDAELGVSRNRNLDGSFGPSRDKYAMLRVSYNLYNGGADLAKHREAAYQVEQAKDIKDRTIREAVERVRLAWADYRTSQKRIPVLRTYKYSSAKTVVAYYEQFQLGKRTLLDLLNSENEAFNASVSYVNEVYDNMIASYRVLNSIGVIIPSLHLPIPHAAMAPYKEYYLLPRMLFQTGGLHPDRVEAAAVGDLKSPPKSSTKMAKASDTSDLQNTKQQIATLKPNYTLQKAAKQQANSQQNYALLPKPVA